MASRSKNRSKRPTPILAEKLSESNTLKSLIAFFTCAHWIASIADLHAADAAVDHQNGGLHISGHASTDELASVYYKSTPQHLYAVDLRLLQEGPLVT